MKLTKQAKLEAISHILKKSFEHRFDKVHEDACKQFEDYLKREHSAFFEALADPRIALYIATGFGCHLNVPNADKYAYLARPMYGLHSSLPENTWVSTYKHNRVELMVSSDVKRPHFLTKFTINPHSDYYTAWDDYIKAQKCLTDLFAAYTTTDKLIADFPEYKDYLPEKEIIKKNLPVVQVGKIRGELSALGIPSE